MSDFYEILGVSRNASSDDIKKAYRALAKKYHPDKNPDGSTEARFKEISEAYSTLSDPRLRQSYDQFGDASGHSSGMNDIFTGFGSHNYTFTSLRFLLFSLIHSNPELIHLKPYIIKFCSWSIFHNFSFTFLLLTNLQGHYHWYMLLY